MGYHLAGFDVVGVDIEPQPNYPFTFIQADAIEYLKAHGHEYDAIHASPPCQAYSNAQRIQQREHPELIGPTRSALVALGRPWVIENVPGAPMHDAIKLCGTMFRLRTYRHRLFEASFELTEPKHPEHAVRQAKMGRPIGEGEFIQVVGNFSNADLAREVMGMPWATRDELREAIPTAYTRFIGEQLLAYLGRQPLQEKGRPMGNTLDMAKIKEDHQVRNERLMQASASGMAVAQHYTDETMLGCYADMLTELALIWREEANRLSELPSPKPRGWKTTMDSLRDCATRVSGIAVAMRNHGLPGDDSGPKARTSNPCDAPAATSTESPALAAGAAQAAGEAVPKESTGPASGTPVQSAPEMTDATTAHPTGEQLAITQPHQDGKSELQEDLHAVYRSHMSVDSFRAKWPNRISEDQMVEFLKNRKGDASPKESASPSIGTPAPGADGSTPVTLQVAPPRPSDDPVAFFLDGLSRGPSKLVEVVHQESLAEAASAIIEQARTRVTDHSGAQFDVTHSANMTVQALGTEIGGQPATVFQLEGFGKSDGALKTWDPTGVPDLGPHTFTYAPYEQPPREVVDMALEQAKAFTIGAADAPPAWAALPEVPLFELDSPMALDSPGHTSVSQANLVSECALKWKLAKRHGAPERPGWALVGGKAFHQVVEWIEAGFNDGSLSDLMVNNMMVGQWWTKAFALAIAQTEAENPLFPIDTWHASNKGKENRAWWDADGPEMVHHYLAWRAKWIADGWELLRTAAGVPVVELEFLAFLGGSPVKGFIDSAWYHPTRDMIAIIDWKSGSTKPADYFQQATYKAALLPLLSDGEYVPKLTWLGAFWDARSGELGPLVDLDVRHPKAEVEMRLSMPRRIDAAGLYMPNVNTGYGGCGSCSLKRSCPIGSRIGTGEVKL